MSRTTSNKPEPRRVTASEAYFTESMRPLVVLAFLLPFVLVYELGSVVYLADRERGVVEAVEAQRLLVEFFNLFGEFGLYLPGAALVLVLVLAHVFSRQAWHVRPIVPALMTVESLALTAPLLVLAIGLGQGAAVQASGLAGAPWQDRLVLAVGAGLYEELLFRMVAIGAIHFIAVDLLRAKELPGRIIAVVLSAAAFALYHDLGAVSTPGALRRMAFLFVGGLYFGILFLWRGFGIAVGVHMAYDALVLLVINPAAGDA